MTLIIGFSLLYRFLQ